VERIVQLAREIRRVLRKDGTFWLNLGDSYSSGNRKSYDSSVISATSGLRNSSAGCLRNTPGWAKPKDRLMVPARVAIALQADGWYLRDEIVWNKPNPMPESVTDRTTKAHEFIYLLTRSQNYFYDGEAIKEPASESYRNDGRWESGPTEENEKQGYEEAGARNPKRVHAVFNGQRKATVNKRSVWTVTTSPCPEAHFATYPGDLIKPCILAGSRPGDTILDPCAGTGTTGRVALELGRNSILIELSPKYAGMCIVACANITPGLPF
jgi:DNA modification methylase